MTDILKNLNLIKKVQMTIDVLLKENLIRSVKDELDDSGGTWTVKTLNQDDFCTMGLAYCGDPYTKDFPDHVHDEVIEYLICVRGSVMEFFDGNSLRVMKAGDCIAVPKGVIHRSKALEPNTILAFICVPADKQFPVLGESPVKEGLS